MKIYSESIIIPILDMNNLLKSIQIPAIFNGKFQLKSIQDLALISAKTLQIKENANAKITIFKRIGLSFV